jgi:hypothetical protein
MENVHNGNIEIISFVGKLRSKPALFQDDYVDPIYRVEPDIKETTGATRSSSYLYLHQ